MSTINKDKPADKKQKGNPSNPQKNPAGAPKHKAPGKGPSNKKY